MQLDARLANNAEATAVAPFKQILYDAVMPLRPGYGTLGRKIVLRSNFFAVKLPKGPWYEYTIEITPNDDLKYKRLRLFELLEQSPQCRPFLPHIAHDSSQRLVSAKKLPDPLDIRILFIEEGAQLPGPNAKTYNIHFSFVQVLDLSEINRFLAGNIASVAYNAAPVISAAQLIISQHSARTAIRVGKNRYFPRSPTPHEQHQLSLGVRAVQGFYASVRPAFNQLMVNVNSCMTPFIYPGKLADTLMAFSRNSGNALPSLPPRFASSIRVTTTYLGYKKRSNIKQIGSSSARRTTFKCDELGGKDISVEEYFKRKYRITLEHPDDLPVVDIASRQKRVRIWVPAELCDVELQSYGEKLSPEETSQMIRVACRAPAVNAQEIIDTGLNQLALTGIASTQASSPLSGFEIQIRPEHATVPARILPAPSLNYSKGRADVKGGAWNIMNVKFHRGGRVAKWWALCVTDGPPTQRIFTDKEDPHLKGLLNGFITKCKDSGMGVEIPLPLRLISPPLPGPGIDPDRVQSLRIIRELIQSNLAQFGKPTFILVLLTREDDYMYPGIKRLGDVDLGIHTLHMLLKPGKNALGEPNKADQYFSNIALKLNTKLGGVNHRLDEQSMRWLLKKRTMLVGIDVTHPSPRSRPGTPSIAAVVASLDADFVHFPASLRLQAKSKKEMVDDLEPMMVERLLAYKAKSKGLPEKIIVFRDGVSEGQYAVVIDEELPKIISACKKAGGAGPTYRPQISIVICGKRHHARFPATNAGDTDRSGNTVPGTIVDQGVTNIFTFDFYLQAHAGLQGTVRPTHYVVIYDESRFGVDEIQQGTHTASYAYARATKAVSLIPPAYYADLACERGRCYLNNFLISEDAGTTSSGQRRDRAQEEKAVFDSAAKAWGNGLHEEIKESMFYL